MAKFYGAIGYSTEVETSPGVWKNQITERHYAGDTIRNSSRWSSSQDSTNDDLNINNQFSILADPYAYQNFHEMKYIEFMGTRWKITNVEVLDPPRLKLSKGRLYNG